MTSLNNWFKKFQKTKKPWEGDAMASVTSIIHQPSTTTATTQTEDPTYFTTAGSTTNGITIGGQNLYGGTPINSNPNTWTTTTDTLQYYSTPPTTFHCPLPEDVLEKMLVLGMANSEGVLKEKIKAAWQQWCKDQTIDTNVFPMLLAFAMLHLSKEEVKLDTKEAARG